MNKGELVDAVAGSAGLSRADATKAVDGILDAIQGTLSQGGSVSLVGFGTFTVKARAARMGRNPRTGEAIQIKAKVEDIIGACIAGHTPLQETLHWMSDQRKNKTKLIEKLADLGLIDREYRPSVPDTLGAFITKYIKSRTDVKVGTLITYRQVFKLLGDYFGEERKGGSQVSVTFMCVHC